MENRDTSLTPHAHCFIIHWGFTPASIGPAVDMANVWDFPYRIGNSGGSTSLLTYTFFALLFTYVGLPAEFVSGHRARTGMLGAYRAAWAVRGNMAGGIGTALGWSPLVDLRYIVIDYAVIVAYVTKTLFDPVAGELMGANTEKWFEDLALQGFLMVSFHVIVMIGTLVTLFLGAKSIERTNRVMMLVLFVIFAVSAVRVAFLPGVVQGYLSMLTPHWEMLVNPTAWVWAMGQTLFSLSVIGSGMIVYGAYLFGDKSVVKVSQRMGFFDTLAAVVAALMIIPACFAPRTDVGAGLGLLFATLPTILQSILLGQPSAVVLHVAMIFVGVSSLQNMFEAVGESLLHRLPRFNRPAVLVVSCIFALDTRLGMGAITSWGSWMNLVSVYIIPAGTSLGTITWFWVMHREELLRAINTGAVHPRGKFWLAVGRSAYMPVAVVSCAVALFGHVVL